MIACTQWTVLSQYGGYDDEDCNPALLNCTAADVYVLSQHQLFRSPSPPPSFPAASPPTSPPLFSSAVPSPPFTLPLPKSGDSISLRRSRTNHTTPSSLSHTKKLDNKNDEDEDDKNKSYVGGSHVYREIIRKNKANKERKERKEREEREERDKASYQLETFASFSQTDNNFHSQSDLEPDSRHEDNQNLKCRSSRNRNAGEGEGSKRGRDRGRGSDSDDED